jgi:integrase
VRENPRHTEKKDVRPNQPTGALSKSYRLTVESGDLLWLDGRWYVTHSGLIRLARRHHCSGISVEPVKELGATDPEHYMIPRRVAGQRHDPTKPPSRWAWRRAWRTLTRECGLAGLRPHDLRHHAITRLAESSEASEQTIMSIAGHVSREMLEHYSHIRQEAKRRAVESLDNVTITSQLEKWKRCAEQQEERQVAGRKRVIGRGDRI